MTEDGSFWRQLKERKVVRVALIYGAAAWGTVEVADVLTRVFELPAWTTKLIVLLLALGFPISLALAWAFDVTPSGVRRASAAPAETVRRKAVFGLALAVLVAGVGTGVWWSANRSGGGTVPSADLGVATVAVLPLENRSSLPDQAYFVDGLHDELIALRLF